MKTKLTKCDTLLYAPTRHCDRPAIEAWICQTEAGEPFAYSMCELEDRYAAREYLIANGCEVKALRLLVRSVKSQPKTECGKHWTALMSGCPFCNPNGEHFHFENGLCDLEPCSIRHGGPR